MSDIDVGCYHCCKIYKEAEIEEWTDRGKTAICPKCNIDSVIFEDVTYDRLKDLHRRQFRTVFDHRTREWREI